MILLSIEKIEKNKDKFNNLLGEINKLQSVLKDCVAELNKYKQLNAEALLIE